MSAMPPRRIKYLALAAVVAVMAGIALFRFAGVEIAYHKYQICASLMGLIQIREERFQFLPAWLKRFFHRPLIQQVNTPADQ